MGHTWFLLDTVVVHFILAQMYHTYMLKCIHNHTSIYHLGLLHVLIVCHVTWNNSYIFTWCVVSVLAIIFVKCQIDWHCMDRGSTPPQCFKAAASSLFGPIGAQPHQPAFSQPPYLHKLSRQIFIRLPNFKRWRLPLSFSFPPTLPLLVVSIVYVVF